ncbi:ABC transporter ATP-binding protein, partial [Parapedobacter sp. DT-150]|uniref:ABC transporter ATP-binding protein n=1 Tax=Parapedobacter sp. DT-150 TaxID=3396162 RepID=UPI003F53FA22
QDVRQLSGNDLRTMRRNMQLVFQDPFASLNPRMTVGAILGEALIIHNLGANAREREERVASLLVKVGLKAEHMRRYPHEFSGGQRQRVALARALARRPQLLLLDEPLAALDKKLRESTQGELMELQRRLGMTFIIVTHDQEEAMTMASRIGVMKAGKLAQVASPRELYEAPRSRWIAEFVGDINLFDGESK